MGNVYNNDNIRIFENEKLIFNQKINCNSDSHKLCSFVDTILKTHDSNNNLNFKIDSSCIIVLDTSIIISTKLKKPSVSFVQPSAKTKFKRKIFLDDENKYPIN
jgi:hypothetical protein